jgi:hypothetical protein
LVVSACVDGGSGEGMSCVVLFFYTYFSEIEEKGEVVDVMEKIDV